MIALQLLINGLIAGSIYALIASGFSLIYSTNRFVHFAHGSVAAIGAYLVYTCLVQLSAPFWLACILSIVLAACIGGAIFALLYKPLMNKKSSTAILLIAGLGLSIILDNLLLLIFGATVKSINPFPVAKGISIFGAIITPLQLVIVLTAFLIFAILWIVMNYTKFGTITRAVADNPELAKISGINTTKVQYAGFMIGSAMAAIAGILIGLEQQLEPGMALHLMISGFTGAVIGGLTSVPGAVLGSYLLGFVENISVWFFPSGYKAAVAFSLLLLFLLIKPTGILGIRKGIRQ